MKRDNKMGKRITALRAVLLTAALGFTVCLSVSRPVQAEAKVPASVKSAGIQKAGEVSALALNKNSLVLRTGTTRKLKAKISPASAKNVKLVWTSSDARIASVSSQGVITARKKGLCTITVSTKDKKHKASCAVKVRLYPSRIRLGKTALTLYQKESEKLSAIVTPSDASSTNVKWTSSDPAVARVSSKGVVTGKRAGTATITAKTNLGALTASCQVTVKKAAYWAGEGGNRQYIYHDQPLKGLQKVGNYYFLFDGAGRMQTGIVSQGPNIYYIKDNGHVIQKKVGDTYYNMDGTVRDHLTGFDYEALCFARYWVTQLTNDSMSMEEKLFACFQWAVNFPYLDTHPFSFQADWVPLYAMDCLVGRGGPCYSNAGAFAYLAKALGYTNVYVCLDDDHSLTDTHGWAEINGLCYDPLFYRVNGSKYYALPYSGWNERPVIKVRLS